MRGLELKTHILFLFFVREMYYMIYGHVTHLDVLQILTNWLQIELQHCKVENQTTNRTELTPHSKTILYE